MTAWHGETIEALREALAHGSTTSERITQTCLERIAALNPTLNAFITVTADAALASARAADDARRQGRVASALHGIPVALKDLIDQAGLRTTAGSRVRADVVAHADAPVTAHLRTAGAVLVGKNNLHEFAFGPTSEDSAFGPAHHPVDPSRSPGGSSGGSAIAVRTGMAIAAIGTDTGGSIRIPAAACGVVGFKPEWGDVPADGVVPLSRQLDHVGPLARTVTDAWLVYETLCGRLPAPTAALATASLTGVRLGVLRGYFEERMDAAVARVHGEAIETLRRAGAVVEPVDLPHAREMAAVYLPIVLGDAAAYHADTLQRRPDDYTPGVRARIEMGRTLLAEDYVRALQGREVIARDIDRALEGRAALILATLPVPAPRLGQPTVAVQGGPEPTRNALLRLTQPFNLGRQPAITLPSGDTPEGLPVGLQVVGARGRTAALLSLALACERALADR
jgi:aspartyl-tRNA(Asn)/glutamyl-tRNA(Gln) amidotransferase subunit A